MTNNQAVAIFVAVVAATIVLVQIYFYFRNKSLEQIREDVYELFLKAEANPDFKHAGMRKMKWVLVQARNLLPGWIQILISDAFLEEVVQSWFDGIKDILDDGKLNRSTKGGE